MRALLFVICICISYLFVSGYEDLLPEPKTQKYYPKKVPGNVHILNPKRYVKKIDYRSRKPTVQTYTVFDTVQAGTLKPLYFFNDRVLQRRFNDDTQNKYLNINRGKKILPSSIIRHKRAASHKAPALAKADNKNKKSVKVAKSGSAVARKKKSLNAASKKLNKEKEKLGGDKKVKISSKKEKKQLQRSKVTKASAKRSKKNKRAGSKAKKAKRSVKKPVKRNKNSKKLRNRARKGNKTVNDVRRMIASRDAAIETYPYVVSIQKDDEHWCAGALLNQRLVITTANCVWKSSRLSRMRIRCGSRYTDRGGQTARIQEVMKHPGWNIRMYPDKDVALLLLDKFIKFSHSVHGVDLPNSAMMPPFDDAWVTGWGSQRRDGIYHTQMTSMTVYHASLMDWLKCNNITQRFGVPVTRNFICLSQLGRRAPCTRDTGSPAVSDGVLWGLASWGIRKQCGTERYPAMFSYLGSNSNLDFIKNATKSLMSEERHYPFMDRYNVEFDPFRRPPAPDGANYQVVIPKP